MVYREKVEFSQPKASDLQSEELTSAQPIHKIINFSHITLSEVYSIVSKRSGVISIPRILTRLG